jgi:hypothetical protein
MGTGADPSIQWIIFMGCDPTAVEPMAENKGWTPDSRLE